MVDAPGTPTLRGGFFSDDPKRAYDVKPMSRRVLKPFLFVAILLAALVVLLVFAAKDAQSYKGRVARNVFIGGVDVSGKTPEELDLAIDEIEQQLRITPVRIATFDGGFEAPGASFGLTIDRPEMRIRALEAQRPAGPFARLSRYFQSYVHKEQVPLVAKADRATTAKTLSEREGSKRRDPVDPQLRVRNGAFAVLPGSDGEGIDVDALTSQLALAAATAKDSITIEANRVPLPSRFTNAELTRLVDLATSRTANPIPIISDGTAYQISSEKLRAWVTPKINDRLLELRLDETKTFEGLQEILGKIPRPAVDAQITISDTGQVVSTPSSTGYACCAPDSVRRLERALAGATTLPVEIDLQTLEPKVTTEELASYKITEPIGTFTTKHKAGEDRVKNIHRIADLVRGQIIPPGKTFSLNGFVGQRTPEKGFVEAHVIEDGVFKDSFGGGISQFTTTLFNAAFFGGLDIPAYKAHSIYISRYPFGREATLSWEQPDLKIRNSTPYGVLIWPTYTASSITVTLYSTEFVKGEAAEPEVTMRGECKVVKTVRTRTYVDGTTKKDTFRAEYLPKEGVGCDGNPTLGATTTTLEPPPTTQPETTTDTAASSDTGAPAPTTTEGNSTPAATVATTKSTKPASEPSGSTNPPRVEAGVTTKAPKPTTAEPAASKPPKTEKPATEPKPTEPKPTEPQPDPGPVVVPVAPPVTGVG